jgi:hypothetical protein
MALDISDGACRVLCAFISKIDLNVTSAKFLTTWCGQEWISLHIGKDVRGVRKFIDELVAAGLIQVVHSGRNKTNITRVNTNLLLELGQLRHEQAAAQLKANCAARTEHTDSDLRSRFVEMDRAESPGPDGVKSPAPDRAKAPGDLISASNQKDLTSTVATPSATQPSGATRLAGGSHAYDSAATLTPPPKPQSSRNFTDDQVGAWEALEATLLSRLEALRLDGRTTSERINSIHQSLEVHRYTIGSELLTAYEQGLTEAHEAQLASEWIMKVATVPTSDPRRYVTTLRAFIRGKADMFTASAESRITKQRLVNAS